MIKKTISNRDDLIDSRDIIARIKELESCEPEDMNEEDREELAILQSVESEIEGEPDWRYGVTLIRDTYFIEYAQQLAEDIGGGESVSKWPFTCIDWEDAANELKQDYSSVSFDGIDYWIGN